MAAPNLEELELLGEFRIRLKDLELDDYLNSDMELLRWIRAREHDLHQAELMLRKHLQWRNEIGYDQRGSWELPKHCEALVPEKIVGFDNENRPLVLTLFGKWDLKKAIQEVGAEAIMKFKWKMFESMKDMMRGKVTTEGVPVTQICTIFDMEGLSASQATLPVLRSISEYSRGFEANFPEFLRICIAINAPWFFPPFYKCVMPFLGQKTREKIHIFGKNREEWVEFLRREIPDHVLPTVYGGLNDVDLE